MMIFINDYDNSRPTKLGQITLHIKRCIHKRKVVFFIYLTAFGVYALALYLSICLSVCRSVKATRRIVSIIKSYT